MASFQKPRSCEALYWMAGLVSAQPAALTASTNPAAPRPARSQAGEGRPADLPKCLGDWQNNDDLDVQVQATAVFPHGPHGAPLCVEHAAPQNSLCYQSLPRCGAAA